MRTGLITCGALLLLGIAVVGAAPPDVDVGPDAEFLEFLGSWQTGDGRWMDPFELGSELDVDRIITDKLKSDDDPSQHDGRPARKLPDREDQSPPKSLSPRTKVGP
jgi:hypothetical protein